MNKQLKRYEILAAHAIEGNPHHKWAAARDLLDAAAVLLKDADEGLMASRLAQLIGWESAAFRGCDQVDCDEAAEKVCEIADRLGERFITVGERVTS